MSGFAPNEPRRIRPLLPQNNDVAVLDKAVETNVALRCGAKPTNAKLRLKTSHELFLAYRSRDVRLISPDDSRSRCASSLILAREGYGGDRRLSHAHRLGSL